MNEQTKLIFPRLAGFYEAMLPVAGTLLRIIVGIMFLMHVSVKFKIGAASAPANIMAKERPRAGTAIRVHGYCPGNDRRYLPHCRPAYSVLRCCVGNRNTDRLGVRAFAERLCGWRRRL